MGVVYEATQSSLDRRVALKVLAMGALISENSLERFDREASLAGKLNHAHIVPVYMVGEEQGIHFYAMQYIQGSTLSEHLKKLKASGAMPGKEHFRTVAQWGRQVAQALAYAHSQGTIHRDIKPSNLILDRKGDVWITDFGLARANTQASLTLTGGRVGTARYMSPEQAQGGSTRPDERTDIYSLGITLYELLTLTPAYEGDSRETVLNRILLSEPVPLRQVNPAIPRDLETMVLKCIQKDAGLRYASADEVADDCARFLHGRAVHARRTSTWVRAARFMKRYRFRIIGSCMVLAMGLIAALLFVKVRLEQGGQQLDQAFTEIFFKRDFQQAERLLDQAASLGVDTERLYLYRGLIPLLLDDTQRAFDTLKEAYDRNPDHAETCFALAYAYQNMGDVLNRDRSLQHAESLEIKTPLGWFLRGLALSDSPGTGALESYNQALALSPDFSPALEVRAKYRADQLLMKGVGEELEPMLSDYNAWVLLQPLSSRAYAARASGWLYAAAYARSRPSMQEESGSWLDKCRDDLDAAQAIQQEGDFRTWNMRGLYLRFINDFHGSAEAYARANEVYRSLYGKDHPPILHHQVLSLHACGELKSALRCVEQARVLWPDNSFPFPMQHALLLAELGELEAARRVLMECMGPENRVAAWLIPSAICLEFIGNRDACISRLQQFDEELALSYEAHDEDQLIRIRRPLDFILGRIDARTLLASAGGQPGLCCEYSFYIALRELGQGRKQAGREALQRSLATGVCPYVEFRFAQVLLARLDADPEWPPW
ncbi:MAG: protein kinase [Planctomycetota bacterium]